MFITDHLQENTRLFFIFRWFCFVLRAIVLSFPFPIWSKEDMVNYRVDPDHSILIYVITADDNQ